MVLITLKPSLAKLLISERESKYERRNKSFQYLEKEIQEGRWDSIPPIWITPNFIFNGFCDFGFGFAFKPFILYNGHHRLEKALEHSLLVKAYVRFTVGNPKIPENEKLQYYDLY